MPKVVTQISHEKLFISHETRRRKVFLSFFLIYTYCRISVTLGNIVGYDCIAIEQYAEQPTLGHRRDGSGTLFGQLNVLSKWRHLSIMPSHGKLFNYLMK